jgi:hypothetical protein
MRLAGAVKRSGCPNCIVIAAYPNAWTRAPLFVVRADIAPSADRAQPDRQSGARPIADLSALESSSSRRTNDIPSGASLFVVRACAGPDR